MSEIKLKPCPFCGGEAHIDCFPGLDRPYFPVCNNEMCIACDTIVTFLTEKDAAEAWNRRAGEQNGRVKIKCAVCGTEFKPKKEMRYTGVVPEIVTNVLYDCYDCPNCGAQYAAQKRIEGMREK